MKAPFGRRAMVALVIRGKIHGDDILRLHALVGKTGRRDQHATGDPVREIARRALVEAVSVHLSAGIDNALAKIGMVAVYHGACSEKAIQDWYAAERPGQSDPASPSGVTASSTTLETGSVRANLRQSNAAPSAVPSRHWLTETRWEGRKAARQRAKGKLAAKPPSMTMRFELPSASRQRFALNAA
jgi:hypothetical protein